MWRPLYVLPIAAPLAVVGDLLHWPSPVLFGLSALGVIPLAGLIGVATEELSARIGPKYGGLLNATFGNAAELIITILAIRQGLLLLVKASITGSIFGNSLLVPGLTTAIFAFVAMDGRSNWLEGAQLLALYVVIAVVFFFLPVTAARPPRPIDPRRSLMR